MNPKRQKITPGSKRRGTIVISSDAEGSDLDTDPDVRTGHILKPKSQAVRGKKGRELQQLLRASVETDYKVGEIKELNRGLVAKEMMATARGGTVVRAASAIDHRPPGRKWFDHVASKSLITTDCVQELLSKPLQSAPICVSRLHPSGSGFRLKGLETRTRKPHSETAKSLFYLLTLLEAESWEEGLVVLLCDCA